MRAIWYGINKDGALSPVEFNTFLTAVKIDLKFSEVQKLVQIFGSSIAYDDFKILIKVLSKKN